MSGHRNRRIAIEKQQTGMNLTIVSVIAGWVDEEPFTYRNGKSGLNSIEKIVQANSGADFILFPGGFIVENRNRKQLQSSLVALCSGFDGMLITGFDRYNRDDELIASPLVIYQRQAHTFSQSTIRSFDEVDGHAAQENRHFAYQKLPGQLQGQNSISAAVVSCGEIFNLDFRKIAFGNSNVRVPDLLFDCVHSGKGFQNEPLRALLNKYSKCAAFYTYHSNSLWGLEEKQFSGAKVEKVTCYPELSLATMEYLVDTAKEYKFEVTRNIFYGRG